MSDFTIARRYARALSQEAEQQGITARIDADMELIHQTMDESRDLVRLFESPVIPREKKESILKILFEAHVDPNTLNFLRLLVEKQREDLFPAITRAYRQLRDEANGVVEAEAVSAIAISEVQQKQLIGVLEQATGRKIRLRVKEEPSLIGGLTVRVGDTVYDGSVRHQLNVLRHQLEHPTSTAI